MPMTNLKREGGGFGIGLVGFLLPLLGFPRAFNNFIFIVAGLVLMVNALRALRVMYREEREHDKV